MEAFPALPICKWRHQLPSLLVKKLHSFGFYFLKDIGRPGVTLLLEQGWLSVDRIGLVDNPDIILWNGYIAMLKAIHVRLYVDDDILVWNQAKSGVYSPKVGYLQMILDRNEVEYS